MRASAVRRSLILLGVVALLAPGPEAGAQMVPRADMRCDPEGQPLGPGESVTFACSVTSTFPHDITVWFGIGSYTVVDGNNVPVSESDARTYASFFTLDIDVQKILAADLAPNEEDDLDLTPLAEYRRECTGRKFTELTLTDANPDGTGCRIGRVRGVRTPPHGPNRRDFNLVVHMSTAGADPKYANWGFGWQAKQKLALQAVDDCEARCESLGPVYKR